MRYSRVCRSIGEVSVVMPCCQPSQPSEVLAAVPSLCRLDSNEVRVSESLVVGVLGIVPAAIGVDEARARASFSGGPLGRLTTHSAFGVSEPSTSPV